MESTLLYLYSGHIYTGSDVTKEHRLVDSDLDPKLIAKISRSKIVGLILYLIAIAVSFLNTNVSLILFALIPVYYFIPQQYFWFRFTKDR